MNLSKFIVKEALQRKPFVFYVEPELGLPKIHYLVKAAENLRELQILFRISMQLLKVLKTLT